MDFVTRRCRGIVREFDKFRGYGTIEIENGERAFVRYSAIIGLGVRTLNCGDRVSFDLEQNHRGYNAVHVTRD